MNDILLTPIRLNELETLIQNSVRKVLSEHNNDKYLKNKPREDDFLTISQAAILLKLAVPTLYGLVHRSSIPVYKRGKRLYFSEKELRDWIKSGRRLTVEEIEKCTEKSLY
jgi:excisionase family DNA binding protein